MAAIRHNHPIRSPAGLMIHVDAQAGEGLQRQVYHSVRRAVLDGVLEPGARLPSSRALADDLRVSRTTTLLAYEQLLAEGYLQTRRGSGTFVAEPLPDDLPLDGVAAAPGTDEASGNSRPVAPRSPRHPVRRDASAVRPAPFAWACLRSIVFPCLCGRNSSAGGCDR